MEDDHKEKEGEKSKHTDEGSVEEKPKRTKTWEELAERLKRKREGSDKEMDIDRVRHAVWKMSGNDQWVRQAENAVRGIALCNSRDWPAFERRLATHRPLHG